MNKQINLPNFDQNELVIKLNKYIKKSKNFMEN